MRVAPLVLVAALVGASPLAAQRTVELTPTVGYRFGGTVDGVGGEFGANDGLTWGVTFDYRVKPDGLVEFVYARQPTTILFSPDTADQVTVGDAAIEYLQVGGALEFGHNEKTKPFFALTVGAAHFDPSSSDLGDDWRFSFGGTLGVKTYLSEKIGLRAQGRVWMTGLSGDTDFWCSLPGGCVIAGDAGTFFTQGEFSGGLMFVF